MKIVYNEKYKNLMVKQLKEQIIFLLKNSIEFSVVVNLDSGVDFVPELPEEITSGFQDFTLFTLAGFTFKSAYVQDDVLIFEAGFGRDNIGAMVYVDIDRILQIVMSETPIFINVTASVAKQIQKDSFEVFSSKSRNKKFFNRNKKQ